MANEPTPERFTPKSDDFGYVRHDYLRRLDPQAYRGQACVHWSMTMHDRKRGWLVPRFYCKFREILTHTMFRYGLCCPIYCCMPDTPSISYGWESWTAATSGTHPNSFVRS